METGGRIRAVRKEKGLTQKRLGELSGIAEPTIRKYELGKLNPKYETLQKIASALDISVDDLLDHENVDREYELICDTLQGSGFKIETAGRNDGTGPEGDIYFVSHVGTEEGSEQITYRRLSGIVKKILNDAELNKADYIQKRLNLELFH